MSALFPDKARDAAPDMDALREELAALRKQVADLVGAAAADGQAKARRSARRLSTPRVRSRATARRWPPTLAASCCGPSAARSRWCANARGSRWPWPSASAS